MKRILIILCVLAPGFLSLMNPQPEIKTVSVSEVNSLSVRVLVTVNGSDVTERGVCYYLPAYPGQTKVFVKNGTGSFGGFSCLVKGLQPETLYCFMGYAISNGSYYYGNEIEVNTLPIPLPDVKTLSVSDIKAFSARIQGSAFGERIQEYGVCYSTDVDQIRDGIHQHVGNKGFGNYSVKLTGLKSKTRYYVTFYARNDAGISYGEAISFQTE